jgi:hypothetical protein
MIQVVRVPISREQFRVLPKEERALLFLIGHALNQIAVLMKLVIFSTNKDPEDPIEGRVSAAQSQIILRFLFGSLVEIWEFLRRPHNQKIIGRYLPLLDKDGTASHDMLKKYFGVQISFTSCETASPITIQLPIRLKKAFRLFPKMTRDCRGSGIFQRLTPILFIFHAKW